MIYCLYLQGAPGERGQKGDAGQQGSQVSQIKTGHNVRLKWPILWLIFILYFLFSELRYECT